MGMLLSMVCSVGIYIMVWFGVGLFSLMICSVCLFSVRVLLLRICGIMMCVGVLVFIFGF